MRSAVVAAAFAAGATASWAPPAYGSEGSWGSTSAAPVASSEAPVYSAPAASSEAPVASSEAPVYSAPAASSEAPVYTTEVVTAYTTFCPEATEITHGGQTYTATEATTLTITNCSGGCTVTYPATSAAPVSSAPPAYTSSAAPVPYPSGNATTPILSTAAPIGTSATQSYGATGSPIPSQVPATGGAAKSYSAVSAAIAAVFGLLATL